MMNNISELYKKQNYLLDIPYISSSYITEYDLSKANISALKYMGYLSDDDYNRLYNTEKMYREIYIGNLERRDKKVTDLKKSGIEEARRLLFFNNNLTDNEILSIKNDAVFVISDRVLVSDFGILKFNVKNVYTFFMKTTRNKLEIYYYVDPISGGEVIDVKGINDKTLEYHRNYLISFMCEIFYLLQTNTVDYTISVFNEFYENFMNKKLDVGYYREFNDTSVYKIRSKNNMTYGFYMIEPSMLDLIDLECNVSLLRDIYAVLVDIYFNKSHQ